MSLSNYKTLIIITLTFILTACGGGDSDGGQSPTPPPAPPSNMAPSANAGNNQTVDEQTSVTLTGTGTDSDGTISSYAWTQTGGTSVTITNANSASATFAAPDINADETLTFELTVTDNDGATASDSVSITIQRVNESPTVDAGSEQTVNEQSTVTLAGTGNDPDGTIESYSWAQTSGTSVTLTDSDSASASFSAPNINTDETLTFELTVTDNDGVTATDTVSIVILRVNEAPMVDAGVDQTVDENTTVTLSGNASDDGSIASYAWTQSSGEFVILATPDAQQTTFTAPDVDEDSLFTFQLTVTDNDGTSSVDSVNININRVNQSPVISSVSAPQYSIEGEQITLEAEASDPDGELTNIAWEVITPNIGITLNNSGSITPTFVAPVLTAVTNVSFQLTVMDNDGETVSRQVNTVVIPTSADLSRPSRAKIVSTTALDIDNATIDWLPIVDDITPSELIKYNIHISDSANFTPSSSTLFTTELGTLSSNITGLTAGSTYYLKVLAEDLGGNESWSLEKQLTMPSQTAVIINEPVDISAANNLAVDPQAKTVQFDAISAPDLAVDDFIVSTEGEGLLAKVVHIETVGDSMVATYEAASLNEVFEELSLNFQIDLEDVPENTTQNNASNLTNKRLPSSFSGSSIEESFTWEQSSLTLSRAIPPPDTQRWTLHSKTQQTANAHTIQASQNSVDIDSEENVSSDGPLTLTSVNSVKAEPGERVVFDVQTKIKDAYDDYEFTEFKLKNLDGPKRFEFVTGNYGANFNIQSNDGLEQSAEFRWDTDDSHYVHDSDRPYTAVFEASAKRQDCLINCNAVAVKIEVPIFIGFFEDLPNEPVEADFTSSTSTALTISADAGIDFVPEMRFNAEIRSAKLKDALVTVGGDLNFNADLTLKASASAQASGQKELFKKNFVKIIPAGTVPILVRGEFTVTGMLDAEALAELDITNEINVDVSVEAGLSYDEINGWQTIQNAEPVLTYTLTGEADGEAEATIRLVPQLTLKVYEAVAATVNVEPYLFAEMGLQGRFDYIAQQSPDFVIEDFDAQYRFTKLDAGAGLDVNLRAGLEIFEKGLIGYPSADIEELQKIEVIEKTTIFGLPVLSVASVDITLPYVDSSAVVFSAVAEDIENPFKNDGSSLNPFVQDSGFWEVFPDTGNISFTAVQEGNNNLVSFSYDTPTVYTIRFVGHSKIGSFIRQYEEIDLDAGDHDNDGMPDIWEETWAITNPNADEDADGLSNLEEFQSKTFPNNPDSDGDGTFDGVDDSPTGPEPDNLLPPGPIVPIPSDESLVAHFKLDGDASNNVTTGQNDGIERGNLQYISDSVSGKAALFDGASLIEIDPDFDIDNDFTVHFFVKTSTNKAAAGMVTKHKACIANDDNQFFTVLYGQGSSRAGQLNFQAHDSSRIVTNKDAVVDNQWHSVAIKVAQDTVVAYVDGLKISETPAYESGVWDNSTPIAIGGFIENACSENHNFVGLIDEVRIYNKALSDEELVSLSQKFNNGLIAYYKFEGNGDDSSGNGNHMQPVGDVTYTDSGISGQSASFDGNGDYFVIDELLLPQGSDTFTVTGWINIEDDFRGSIFGQFPSSNTLDTNLFVSLDDDSFLLYDEFKPTQGNLKSNTSLVQNQWISFAVVRSGQNRKIYLDGKLSAEDNFAENYQGSSVFQSAIGARLSGGEVYQTSPTYEFEGQIDELRVYNRALSADEVSALAQSDGLIAYYPFNEDANDYSGNNLHATGHGDVSFSTGIKGNAVDLDGSGDYLATSTITEDWNSWSFSVWVNPRDFDTSANAYAIVEREIIGSYQDFELLLVGSRGTVVLEND